MVVVGFPGATSGQRIPRAPNDADLDVSVEGRGTDLRLLLTLFLLSLKLTEDMRLRLLTDSHAPGAVAAAVAVCSAWSRHS